MSDEEEAEINRGIALDPDNPEWTEEDFRRARPIRDVPELRSVAVEAGAARPDDPVRVEIEFDVVERFRAEGPDWRERINAALRKAVGLS